MQDFREAYDARMAGMEEQMAKLQERLDPGQASLTR